MTTEAALKLFQDFGVADEINVEARAKSNYYGGAWVVYGTLDYYEKVLLMTTEPVVAARWINDFERLRGNMPPLPNLG